ncbi:PREDICTED: uncharacterized protein LOC108975348 [Bactrocera latifrons]|uniref:uncharacterized protein LOC108975348 n=1 Tax=Bactrocera latifrons TaxID=174628 RepID=UPI0008DDA329|nr:PREDICTED: uncharacterized protein LOC108975348 [Bactrocera latifrons]
MLKFRISKSAKAESLKDEKTQLDDKQLVQLIRATPARSSLILALSCNQPAERCSRCGSFNEKITTKKTKATNTAVVRSISALTDSTFNNSTHSFIGLNSAV